MTTETVHAHRWTIDPPNGATSVGVCECGETRGFGNSIADVFNREYDEARANGFRNYPVGFDYASLPPVVSPRESGRWRSLGVEGCYTMSSGGRSYD